MMTARPLLLAALLAAILSPGTGTPVAAEGRLSEPAGTHDRAFAPGGAPIRSRAHPVGHDDLLKQQVVIDNRGGAAGNIGVEAAGKGESRRLQLPARHAATMAINPNYYVKFPVPAT